MTMQEILVEADALLKVKAKNTRKNYMLTYRELGNEIPTKISVAQYIADCKEKYKPATINIRLAALSWLVKHFTEYIPDALQIQRLASEAHTKPEQEIIYATKEQADNVIRNSDTRTALAVGLMFYAGLRISDAVALKVSDWKNTEDGCVISFKNEKTKVLIQVPVCNKLQELYDKYKKRDRLWTVMSWTQHQNDDTVLVGKRGAVSNSTIFRDIKAVCRECGYPELHPHAFRHGLATALAKENASPNVIKNILGHTSMAMTDRYIHLSTSDKKEALDAVFS